MKRIFAYLPTLVVLVGITYVSLLREPSISLPRITGADKWAHWGMYAVLSVVFLFDSWRDQRNNSTKQFCWLHFAFYILFMLYGGVIELLQEYFFYPRTGTWGDWLADIAGCAVGFILFLIVWKRAKTS